MKILKTWLMASVLIWGCSKNKEEPKVPEKNEVTPLLSVEEKMANAQAEVAGEMCQRITDCAVAAAKEALSDKQEIDRAMVEKKRVSCEEAYTSKKMSGRQINNVASCLSTQNECQPFVTCVGEALKPAGS